jgi:DNA polymerase-3 subunit epsilon
MRQIILDTETTGLHPDQGHRVIEIGCLEMVNRRLTDRSFHVYINPEREIDAEAMEVHGITNEFLANKPNFAGVLDEFIAFVRDAELIAHNAPFDVGFLDAELARIPQAPTMAELIAGGQAIDTLALAKEKRPGKRNSLDALCRDYQIDARMSQAPVLSGFGNLKSVIASKMCAMERKPSVRITSVCSTPCVRTRNRFGIGCRESLVR